MCAGVPVRMQRLRVSCSRSEWIQLFPKYLMRSLSPVHYESSSAKIMHMHHVHKVELTNRHEIHLGVWVFLDLSYSLHTTVNICNPKHLEIMPYWSLSHSRAPGDANSRESEIRANGKDKDADRGRGQQVWVGGLRQKLVDWWEAKLIRRERRPIVIVAHRDKKKLAGYNRERVTGKDRYR